MVNIVSSADEYHRIPEYLKKDGYAVIRGIYSLDECRTLRETIDAERLSPSGSHPGDQFVLANAVHLLPALEDYVSSRNLIKVLNHAFSNNPYCFTSHSDIHVNSVSGWHKDDGKGKYFESCDDYTSSSDCQVFKVAFYLQDCSTSGGLSVKAASHASGYSKFGLDYNSDHPEVYLPSLPGDIVIFDVRITHKGDSNSTTALSDRILRKLGLVKDKKLDYQRFAMFFSFGLENKYTYVFSEKNMERQIKDLGNTDSSSIPPSLSKKLKSQNVGTRDFGELAKSIV
ncbi:phytanoyl-CoA dioxygenase family protein [Planktomarina sp.]|nr:phytanoyl-CoA dioxygenase family protein [Planktomarina temperata]MDC3221717.1 phytanoyl-CoA dioxygenase family protein [Planktomarina sp.]